MITVACEEFHRLNCSGESGETQETALRQAMRPQSFALLPKDVPPAEYPLSPDRKELVS